MTGSGVLTLIGTPIGNLGDLAPRAVEALANAEVIACEDTRNLRKLLSAAGVSVTCWVGGLTSSVSCGFVVPGVAGMSSRCTVSVFDGTFEAGDAGWLVAMLDVAARGP